MPLAFESDDQRLQVATKKDRDRMPVYRYNPNEKRLGELITSRPRYDMGAASQGQRVAGVLVSAKDDKIVAHQVYADKRETVWIGEARAKAQRTIDATLPHTIDSFASTLDSHRALSTAPWRKRWARLNARSRAWL